jgi:hypothetical protein
LAYLANRAALLWGSRDADYPELTAGITSGQGNQGSSATTLNQSQAGTGAIALDLPRALKTVGM